MRLNKFFHIIGILFFIFAIVPGTAFCDLKPLEDTDLSKIEGQSGFFSKEKGLLVGGKHGEFSDCTTGEDAFCGDRNAKTCSTGVDCFNSEPFTVNYPNPTQTYYINQGPSCRSGGCGK